MIQGGGDSSKSGGVMTLGAFWLWGVLTWGVPSKMGAF